MNEPFQTDLNSFGRHYSLLEAFSFLPVGMEDRGYHYSVFVPLGSFILWRWISLVQFVCCSLLWEEGRTLCLYGVGSRVLLWSLVPFLGLFLCCRETCREETSGGGDALPQLLQTPSQGSDYPMPTTTWLGGLTIIHSMPLTSPELQT